MNNIYAEQNTDLSEMLHGVARLHVHLGRMDQVNITTRGWTYNDLVNGIIGMSNGSDDRVSPEDYPAVRLERCISVLFDTLDAITEIGSNAVTYLTALTKLH